MTNPTQCSTSTFIFTSLVNFLLTFSLFLSQVIVLLSLCTMTNTTQRCRSTFISISLLHSSDVFITTNKSYDSFVKLLHRELRPNTTLYKYFYLTLLPYMFNSSQALVTSSAAHIKPIFLVLSLHCLSTTFLASRVSDGTA